MTGLILATAFGALNLLTFHSFRNDKRRAQARLRRVPEHRLLLLAAAGGTPAAYAARRIYRHKTRKQPFSAQLHGIALMQLAALATIALHTGAA